EPAIAGTVEFSGGAFSSVAAAVNGGTSSLRADAGEVDFKGQFSAAGLSPRALVQNLSGTATLKVNAASAGSGTAAGLLGAMTAVTQAESIVPGDRNAPIEIDAELSAENGVITITDGAVKSRSYGGAFSG